MLPLVSEFVLNAVSLTSKFDSKSSCHVSLVQEATDLKCLNQKQGLYVKFVEYLSHDALILVNTNEVITQKRMMCLSISAMYAI